MYIPFKCRKRAFAIQASAELGLRLCYFTSDGVVLDVPGRASEEAAAFQEYLHDLVQHPRLRWSTERWMRREESLRLARLTKAEKR